MADKVYTPPAPLIRKVDMILFEEDWDRFPDAIPDWDTKNKSFLHYCSLLKMMGVKNYKFPLALMNPILKGVDPHDPNLSDAMAALVRAECERNIWYYLREVARVPPSAGIKPAMLEANRSNVSLAWCFINHVDYFVVQCRQTGKSLIVDLMINWIVNFGAWNTKISYLTKDRPLISSTIGKLKKIRGFLPPKLIPIRRDEPDNATMFTLMERGNIVLGACGQNDEDSALKMGRGLTSPIIVGDEVAFISNVHVAMPAALGGVGAARSEAAESGSPYGNIFATTAGKLNTPEGKFAYSILKEAYEWSESLFDTENIAVLHNVICTNSGKVDEDGVRHPAIIPTINGTFSHRQLGKTDEWLKQRVALTRGSLDDIRRDFYNEWTSGTNTNPIPTAVLREIKKGETPAVWTEITPENYAIKWWVDKMTLDRKYTKESFLIGLDTSGAQGTDNMIAIMMDISTLEVIGELAISETNLVVFSRFLSKFLLKYSKAVLIPENTSTWCHIRDQIIEDFSVATGVEAGVNNIGKRVFSRVVDEYDDVDGSRETFRDFSRIASGSLDFNRYRKYFGFITSASSREIITGPVLQEACARSPAAIRSSGLIDELSTLVRRNDRVDHAVGAHDDRVMAWLFCHWFLSYARNVQHYGIQPSKIRSKVRHGLSDKDEAEISERMENVGHLKDELARLTEALAGCSSMAVAERMRRKLERLTEELEGSEVDVSETIDQKRAARRESAMLRSLSNRSVTAVDVKIPGVDQSLLRDAWGGATFGTATHFHHNVSPW